MLPTDERTFAELLTATMEVYGARITPASVAIWWAALRPHPLAAVRAALDAYVRTPGEGVFAPKPASIIALLQAGDGRPGPEEAWSEIAHALGNEGATLVLTEEQLDAFFVADSLADERIAARMAFKEHYVRAVQQARAAGKPVKWVASLGHDPHGRADPLQAAVRRGRITAEAVRDLLPYLPAESSALVVAARAATKVRG